MFLTELLQISLYFAVIYIIVQIYGVISNKVDRSYIFNLITVPMNLTICAIIALVYLISTQIILPAILMICMIQVTGFHIRHTLNHFPTRQ